MGEFIYLKNLVTLELDQENAQAVECASLSVRMPFLA